MTLGPRHNIKEMKEERKLSEVPPTPSKEGESESLWVIEGTIDFPVYFPPHVDPETGAENHVVSLPIDFSGGDGDGFIELRPVDRDRSSKVVWWTRDEPVLFRFRASVIAGIDIFVALLKAEDFLEQALDRVTFAAGTPAMIRSKDQLYNETQLIDCAAKRRATYFSTPLGTFTRPTHPMLNLSLFPNYARLSPRAIRALRWFRKGLTAATPEDRYAAFYISLEAISDDIKPPAEIPVTCPHCGKEASKHTVHSEGMRELVSARGGTPKVFRELRKSRGRILHGGAEVSRLRSAGLSVPLVRQLAQDGIARSLGADPDSVQIAEWNPIDMALVGETPYDSENNPHKKWGRPILEVLTEGRAAIEAALRKASDPDQGEGTGQA